MYRRAARAVLTATIHHRQFHCARIKKYPVLSTVDFVRIQQLRSFHYGLVRYVAAEKSKVEETLRMLKEDLKQQEKDEDVFAKKTVAKKDEVKPPLSTRIMNELRHYYHGFRLLALETRLSAKYLWRVAMGHSLTRRERQQLVRTVSDLFRLVPFSIFIIVPFLEFTLPIFLKVFPNMLPSTFQEASKQEEKLRRQLKVKLEMAKFLQDTISEIGLERKSKGQKPESNKALEFAEFMKKVRAEGLYVSNAEIFKYSKLFEDELTLDNLSISSLRALCRLLDIQPLGSPEILRFLLNLKLRELKADDKAIALEGGVDVLSVTDLQQACRARGMRALGMSEQRLKDQLNQWLELSLNDQIPPSLLLLSRAMYISEDMSFTDRLKALLSNVPEGVAEQTRQKLLELEGNPVSYKDRLELIKNIEKAIEEERKSAEEAKKKITAEEEAKKAKIAEAAAAEELAKKVFQEAAVKTAVDEAAKVDKEHLHVSPGVAPSQIPTAEQIVVAAAAAAAEKPEETAKVDEKDLRSIEKVIHGSAVSEAKHDITELKEKVIEHTEDLIEVDALKKDLSEPKGAKRLRSRVNHIIENLDSLVTKLEGQRKVLSETIADPAVKEAAGTKKASLMRVDDLVQSINRLQKLPDEEKRKEIEQIVRAFDDDTDGVIDANIVLEAIDLLSKHKDLKISAAQMKDIVEMLKKEEAMEELEAFISGISPYPPAPPETTLPADAARLLDESKVAELEPKQQEALKAKKNSV